jgi:hypothetical protein
MKENHLIPYARLSCCKNSIDLQEDQRLRSLGYSRLLKNFIAMIYLVVAGCQA